MRYLSVMCSMCSCFLDAIQTRLSSNQLAQVYSFSPPSQENLKEALITRQPNLKRYLNLNVNHTRF